jgi:predicted dehydrogenase
VTPRVLLVGAGAVCGLWLPVVARMADAELCALVDLDPARARALLAAHGVEAAVETHVAAALARHRPAIVADLTPPASRRAVDEAAFAAGCDVIAEKPLAGSLDEGRALVGLADAAGRRLVVMQNHRHHPGARALRAAVAAGQLGDVALVAGELHRRVERFERAAAMAHPFLGDMAIHDFDQARHLTGREPERVLVHERNPAGSEFPSGAVAVCTFLMTGGCVFSYRGSWAAGGLETPWFGEWRVDGSRASARWDGAGRPVVETFERHTEAGPQFSRRELEVAPGPNDHPAAVPALIGALAAGEPVDSEARDNLRSLAMVTAAIESAERGQWVEVAGG